MKKSLILSILFIVLLNASLYAEENAVGNKGYVVGQAPSEGSTEASGSETHERRNPIKDIWGALIQLDEKFQKIAW